MNCGISLVVFSWATDVVALSNWLWRIQESVTAQSVFLWAPSARSHTEGVGQLAGRRVWILCKKLGGRRDSHHPFTFQSPLTGKAEPTSLWDVPRILSSGLCCGLQARRPVQFWPSRWNVPLPSVAWTPWKLTALSPWPTRAGNHVCYLLRLTVISKPRPVSWLFWGHCSVEIWGGGFSHKVPFLISFSVLMFNFFEKLYFRRVCCNL